MRENRGGRGSASNGKRFAYPTFVSAASYGLLLWTALIFSTSALASRQFSGQDRTSSPFPRPAGLVPAIGFWTRIFAELGSDTGLVHDERRLDRVYRTLYLNPGAPYAAQDDTIENALAQYRSALLRLASGKRTGLTAIERQALTIWGESSSAAELEAAAERVRFQRGQADRFRRSLARSRRWSTRIRAILEKHGLPPALAALPHVESSYNPLARSKAGAAGLWQFMPSTARRYLRVDQTVDERLDPYRATEAAALLLKQNYSVLRSWPLAITAYNHGLSGVRRAQRELGTDDLSEIIEKYKGDRFGFASRNFYAAFLAAADVAADSERYFGKETRNVAGSIELVTPSYLPVEVILLAFDVDKDQLRALNPSLHHAVWNGVHFVPEDYPLTLPGGVAQDEAEELLARLSRHFGFASQRPYGDYEVRLGDSVSVIALRHDTGVAGLMDLNGLSTANDIRVGQTLRVPMGPIPEPLGAGSAAMLKSLLERGDLHKDVAVVADVPRVLAVAAGLGYPGAAEDAGALPSADPCREMEDGRGEKSEPMAAGADTPPADSAIAGQPDLVADPADYRVAKDGSIEIQIAETMGHYGHWLGMTSKRLRKRIGMDDDDPLVVGRRLKLDFSRVGRKRFEQYRIAFHKARQQSYFETRRIASVIEHRIRPGDNLWLLAEQQYRIPMWLLRQYNPDIATDTVLTLDRIIYVPLVEERVRRPPCVADEATGRASECEGRHHVPAAPLLSLA